MTRPLMFAALLTVSACASAQKLATYDAVTFSDTGPGKMYFPIRELSKNLGWKLTGDPKNLILNGHTVPANTLRPLPSGARLVHIGWLRKAGAILNPNPKTGWITIKDAKKRGSAFYVRRGLKRVFINKKTQTLLAFQGQRTVLRTHVSTGRRGQETPLGLFRAKAKEKLHLSRLYDNVPMPWSIHIVGNIFVHGFKSTPRNASSGCIRVPLTGANPARWLYYWADIGTPITISGKWPKGARAAG